MVEAPTNAVIACLRALSNESGRLEQRLKSKDLGDERSERLGYYMMDLQESIAWVAEVYETHRAREKTLAPVAELLDEFRKNEEF
jgi:hypothetical protein